MARSIFVLSWIPFLTVAVALAAPADLPQEELERNRRRFEEWRKHPDQLDRLRKEAKAFFELPEEQRQKIIQLDHDLHDENPANQARLTNIMGRYVEWFDKLDAKDRQRIRDAPDRKARLAIVKDLRDQEWMMAQPLAVRRQYTRLEGDAREGFVVKARLEDHQRRLEWKIAARFWKELEKGTPLPCRITDFPTDVINYVNDFLRPSLSPEEEDRLVKAQGQWPLFPLTLVELADRHPLALPGPKGPKSFAELPAEVKAKLRNPKAAIPKLLNKADKHWPGFASAVAAYAAEKHITLSHELWPWGHSCLSPRMQEFVDKKLTKVLNNDEKLRLISAEKKWPEYPLAIQELARKYNLEPPWQTLPDPRERWDRYRNLRAAVSKRWPETPDKNLSELDSFGLSQRNGI